MCGGAVLRDKRSGGRAWISIVGTVVHIGIVDPRIRVRVATRECHEVALLRLASLRASDLDLCA